ncbi:hypothetical protein [Methylomonas koyamae]|uniref:hypothetical protein n=1 Tax=Methylomonas koyamae TaxID=702114 RepID=UPI002873ECEE|nr:hypothetical protein [Methylomonas koyamae]WNB77186.1 hypothetical protein RI210_06335 [Methylomonas koyamae]
MNNIKPIHINNLLLDLENPRFPREANGQRDAINLMLEIQEEKIINLAKDISSNGTDPSENLMVYESNEEPGFFIVAEGNRRTTALKLIAQSNLADNEKTRKIFTKIKETTTRDISTVNCVVFNNESYEHWVSIKHTGDNKGVGRERWTTPEADRYKAKHGKTSYQSQLYEFMLRQENAYAEIIKKKNFIKSTNLSRLFGDKKTQARFGLTSLDGYLYCSLPYNKFVDNYKKVLDVMTDINPDKNKPDFNVAIIYKSHDREVFLDDLGIEINPNLLPRAWKLDDEHAADKTPSPTKPLGNKDDNDANNEAPENTAKPTDSSGNTNAENDTAPPTKPTRNTIPKVDRNILIPSTLKLNFGGNKKCSRIFNELKTKMNHADTGFAIAVMLRVFIDLTLTAFIEKKNLRFKDHPREPGLHDKVVMCCDHLKSEKSLTQAQISSICAFSKDKLASKGTIQQYVHNHHHIPSKDIVNTEWDNFQPLFEAIWSPTMQN